MYFVDVLALDSDHKHYEYYERSDAITVFNKEVADVNSSQVLLGQVDGDYERIFAFYSNGSGKLIKFGDQFTVELRAK